MRLEAMEPKEFFALPVVEQYDLIDKSDHDAIMTLVWTIGSERESLMNKILFLQEEMHAMRRVR